jgi:asparagine synthetase B (glutamine-hydrolysing)
MVRRMTDSLRHRGPDSEGFALLVFDAWRERYLPVTRGR